MNRHLSIRLIIAAMTVLALGGCNGPRGAAAKDDVSAQERDTVWGVGERKSALLSYLASSNLSNAGKGEVVRKEISRLESLSNRTRSYIEEYLVLEEREAFREERKAYSHWWATQQHLSDRAIIFFWDLYAGGSAGASFQTAYLYDVENLNFEDMKDLLKSLQGQSYDIPKVRRVTSRQLEREHASIVREAEERGLPQEVINLLNGDYYLFKSWMRKRKEFSQLLPRGVAASYDRMTRVIINEHLWQYEFRFIGDEYARRQRADESYRRHFHRYDPTPGYE